MKRLYSFVFMIWLTCNLTGCEEVSVEAPKIKIGIVMYQEDDTFVSSIRNYIIKLAKEQEIKDNIKITLNITDAAGQQTLQNDQVNVFIAQNYDVICVNMVDRTAAAVIIDKAKEANIPLIFFNREPVREDLERWDQLYYVGAKAEQSGIIQGQLVSRLFYNSPERIDKNGDGILQYVMIEGELGHQDALLRTEYAIRSLIDNGIKVEKLANDSASWKRSLAKEKMSGWLNQFGDDIEVVFANNDDMALGAIDAAKDAGYTFSKDSNMVIVGIDATAVGIASIKNGQMYATVFNNAALQGQAIFEIAYSLVTEGKARVSMEGFDGKYLLTDYKEVTLDIVYDLD